MKIILLSILSTLLVLFIVSCKTTKYVPTDFPDDQITFGTGGGFSGIVTDYTLLSNGQLFKRSSTDNKFVELPKIAKEAATQAFTNYDFLGLSDLEFNAPANFYYFINYTDKNKNEHKIVWGDEQNPIDPKVKTYYKILTTFISQESKSE